MSGPSATAKPMSAKIAVSSSVTWLIGWTRPLSAGVSATGKVRAVISVLSLASSAAAPSLSFASAIAAVRRSFNPLMAGPWILRSSGVMLPSVLSSADTEPLLPNAATRTASSAASSLAEATAASRSCSICAISVMAHQASSWSWPGLSRPSTSWLQQERRGCPARGRACFLSRQSGLGLFDDCLEGRGLANGKVGQHLAINGQTRFGEASYEAAVIQPEWPHRRVQALDPERAECALAPLAIAESILVRLLHRLLGDANRVFAAAIIAFGGLEDLLVLGMRRDTTLDAGHGKSPCRTSEWLQESRGQLPEDRSAVGQPVLLDGLAVGFEQHLGAAMLADCLGCPLDHAVALAGLLVFHLAGRRDLDALFCAGLVFQFGH